MIKEYRLWLWRYLLFVGIFFIHEYLLWPNMLAAMESQINGEISQEDNHQNENLSWGEIYTESVATQNENYNLVSDLFVKQGIHAFKLQNKDIDLYLKGRLYADHERYYWNNRFELGVGIRYIPSKIFGLILFSEFLYGHYTGRDREDELNPNDAPYLDFQGGMAFWQLWGKQVWQIESEIEFCSPFKGWRELYGDCIYYHHANRDMIATLDYKEGLFLARFGPFAVDAYITLEGSWDKNALEWYNFMDIGLGIRAKPFEKLDLKISAEYLWDYYYRGGFNGMDIHNSGLVIRLDFWHGW
jgi:hypothetical protein